MFSSIITFWHIHPQIHFTQILLLRLNSLIKMPGMTKTCLQTVTSITGVSAMAVRTTLLASASACATVSASAENGQEAMLNIHRKIPGSDGMKSTFISSVA